MPPKRKRPGRPPKPQVTNPATEAILANAGPEKEHSFKNKAFESKSKGKSRRKGRGGKRNWKSLKQMISLEGYQGMPPSVPTYLSIQAGPSVVPPKKYCDLSGFEARYREPTSGLLYTHMSQHSRIKQMPMTLTEKYLKLRGAAVKL